MPQLKLTEKALKKLRSEGTDKQGGVQVRDSVRQGCGCTVYPTGRIIFWCRYGPRHRRRWHRIGEWGKITLTDAREEAKDILAQADLGEDPVLEMRRDRQIPLFKDWVSEYLKGVRERKKRPEEDERYLGRAVKRWGPLPLDEITSSDVEAAMQDQLESVRTKLEQSEAKRAEKEEREPAPIPETAGRTTANRFLASVAACLQLAWRRAIIRENPAARVRAYREADARSRVLTDKEMAKVLEAINAEEDPFVRAAFKLLIETGARRSEVLNAKWKDVDLDQGLWRIPSTKAGRPQVQPLLDSTIALLSGLEHTTGPYVISGRFPDRPRADLKKAWERIRTAAGVPDVRVHDIRRTFGLKVAKTAGLHAASKLLRHTSVRETERVYAPLGIDDLREALKKAHESDNVVDIKKKRRNRVSNR
jgi:integrase